MKKILKITILLLIFGCHCILYGQKSNIQFERISIKDGLSQNTVTCIFQDSHGFMWFGTYDGLNRYDGKGFKIFKHDPKNNYTISQNSITSICEDKYGKLWIGTSGGGLNSYNSEKEIFSQYKYKPGDSNCLSNNVVRSIYEDKSGNLWVGTWGGGLNLYDRINNCFINYKHDPNRINSLIDDRIAIIDEDHYGNLWIATANGLGKYDKQNNQFTGYKNNPSDPYSLSLNDVSTVHVDKNDNIWAGTWGGGLDLFDPTTEEFVHFKYDPKNPNSLSHNIIRHIYSDDYGKLYVSTWGGGLNLIDHESHKISSLKNNPSDPTSISGDFIYSVYINKTGILWIGTDFMGINKFDPKKLKFTHYKKDPLHKNSLSHNTVSAIIQDKNNNIWMGTGGGGLNKYDLKKDLFTHYISIPNNLKTLTNNEIHSICLDPSGKIWIGTIIGLNEFDPITEKAVQYLPDPDDDSSVSFHNIWSVYVDKSGTLWVGTYSKGLDRFDRKEKKFIHYRHNPDDEYSISDDYIWDILEDRYGNLWIGTDKGGLNRLDRQTDQFIHYINDPANPNSISDNKIMDIFEDSQGILWIGTTSGLNTFNQKTKLFIQYKIEDGLQSNTIQSICEDKHNNLWIGTINGLSKYDRNKNQFYNYTENNGLQSNEFSVGSCLKIHDDRLIFGGVNGYNFFNPDSIQNNPYVPPIVFTSFQLFNKDVPIDYSQKNDGILMKSITETDEIHLSHMHNVFSFEYAALSFSSPDKNQYAYKMAGFEDKWNYVGNRTFVTYTNLSPGSYEFMVKGSNNDGIWNEKGISIKIIITPPYWQTAWFRLFSILFILSLIFLGYKYKVNRIKVINKELEYRVEERTIQLNQTNKELESFMYSISHDLRAPLRAMSGFSDILMDDFYNKLNENGQDYLMRIHSASKQMGNLIDDLLKLSRLSRNEMQYEIVNLSNLITELLESLAKASPERKAEFKITPSLTAQCDKGLMKIMLKNLIDNAWKFTSKNNITKIEFNTIKIDGNTAFYIKDNGVGFNMDYVEKLFEPFQRQNIEFEGTGIGLTTVKRIIQRHEGKIWAEGKVNEGASFFFTLS